MYRDTEFLSPDLKRIKNAIQSLRPALTESERKFSTVGSVLTKVRNMLSSKTLDACTFAKKHYINTIKQLIRNASI